MGRRSCSIKRRVHVQDALAAIFSSSALSDRQGERGYGPFTTYTHSEGDSGGSGCGCCCCNEDAGLEEVRPTHSVSLSACALSRERKMGQVSPSSAVLSFWPSFFLALGLPSCFF